MNCKDAARNKNCQFEGFRLFSNHLTELFESRRYFHILCVLIMKHIQAF